MATQNANAVVITGGTVSGVEQAAIFEKRFDLGNLSGVVAVDYNDGPVQYGTLTGDITDLSFSNWPVDVSKSGYLTLEITQDGTGERVIDFAGFLAKSGVVALGGEAAALTLLHFHGPDSAIRVDEGSFYEVMS